VNKKPVAPVAYTNNSKLLHYSQSCNSASGSYRLAGVKVITLRDIASGNSIAIDG